MPITELEGAVGSRNVRRLTAAPSAGGSLGAPRARVSASPVSGGIATPQPGRSSLHEVAAALAPFSGKLQKLADDAAAKQRDEQKAAGRLAAESGEVRSLDDITDASEAYREGAAAALGERIGFDALSELQRQAEEGLNDPNFDFDTARKQVVTQFFGADPSRSGDPTLVQNGLDVFSSRSAGVGAHYKEAVRQTLEGETRDVFLSNAATKARSLAGLPAAERLPTLNAEMQALIADGKKLGLEMPDINNQRIFIVETLATETGQLGLFDTFAVPDPSGSALRDHPKFGPHVESALQRATSAVAQRNAAGNALAELNQRRDDAKRLAGAFGMSQAEVDERVQLPQGDPRRLSVSQALAYSEHIAKVNGAELAVRADAQALVAGGVVEDPKQLYAAVDRVAAGMAAADMPPENIAAVRNAFYSRHGTIDPDYKAKMKADVLSSDPERSVPAIAGYRDLRATNPNLAESLIDEDVRTTARAWDGLFDAGFPDDAIAKALSATSADLLSRRQEFLANHDNRALVENAASALVDTGYPVGNLSKVRDRIRDIAAAVIASGLVNTPAAAVAIARRSIENVTAKVPGTEVRVDRGDVTFGWLDPDIMAQFAEQWVRPTLNNMGLDPDRRVDVVPMGRRGNEAAIIDEESGTVIEVVNFGEFESVQWRRMQNQMGTEAARAAAAAATAVDRNALVQDRRTETDRLQKLAVPLDNFTP